MKTFNDVKITDYVYTIAGGTIFPHEIIRSSYAEITVLLNKTYNLRMVIPRFHDTEYGGVYSCIEALMKAIEDEI